MENKINLEEQKEIVSDSIQRIINKESKVYVLIQDTKGNAKFTIKYSYDIVKNLIDLGYDAKILLEDKNSYQGVSGWLPSEYDELPSVSISDGDLSMNPDDTVIIPELYAHVMEQTQQLPCNKVVLCTAYDNIFETMKPGANWVDFGYRRVITTNMDQKKYLKQLFPNVNIDVVSPFIEDHFKPFEKPQKPVIAIHTREQRDTMKLIKTFYVKYPQYKWVSFKDMRNLSHDEFSSALKECAFSVWVDDVSGHGTFPLESMKCGVPVIGKVPNLQPDWMTDDNGLWTIDFNGMVDVIATIMKHWLEDTLPTDIYEHMEKTSKEYTKERFNKELSKSFELIMNARKETLKEVINQYEKLEKEGEVQNA